MGQTLPPDSGGQNRINPHYGGAYGLMWRFYRQPETIASLFEKQRSSGRGVVDQPNAQTATPIVQEWPSSSPHDGGD